MDKGELPGVEHLPVDRPEDLPIWEEYEKIVSVIIPTLNEADNISNVLRNVKRGKNVEIIVVDGGSSDGTIEQSREHDVTVIESPPGLAKQLNTGAKNAKGEFILFLHSDTLLPDNYDDYTRNLIC